MKRIALILFGIYFVFSIGIKAQEKVDEAEKAVKNGDFKKALSISKELIDANTPGDAIKILIMVREKDPSDKLLYEYLGDAYAKMNVGELAISNYADAEKIDSMDVGLKFKSAEALYKQKKYTDAVNKYLKVIAIDPNNKEAYIKAATIFFQAKLYADAAIMYEKYLGIDQSKEAFENIAKAFLETANYEKAYEYSVKGIAKYPNDNILIKDAAFASYAIGTISLKTYQDSSKTMPAEKANALLAKEKQKYEEAGKYYSQLPDSLLTVGDLKNAGYSYQTIGADSLAIKFFEKVVKKDSTQSSLFMDMANNYFRNKQNDLAAKYYQAKINVDSTYEPAYRYMGFAYFGTGEYDGARKAFIKAAALADTSFETHYWLAETYVKMDSTEQASEQFSKILKLAEGKEDQYKDRVLEASAYLGQRAFIRKNYSGAITYLSKAIRLKPGEARIMEMLGACYHQLQNFDEAIKWYRAALKANPKSEVAKKGLRMLSAD
jgi:tetratricopeptide (TPR) repeat protein